MATASSSTTAGDDPTAPTHAPGHKRSRSTTELVRRLIGAAIGVGSGSSVLSPHGNSAVATFTTSEAEGGRTVRHPSPKPSRIRRRHTDQSLGGISSPSDTRRHSDGSRRQLQGRAQSSDALRVPSQSSLVALGETDTEGEGAGTEGSLSGCSDSEDDGDGDGGSTGNNHSDTADDDDGSSVRGSNFEADAFGDGVSFGSDEGNGLRMIKAGMRDHIASVIPGKGKKVLYTCGECNKTFQAYRTQLASGAVPFHECSPYQSNEPIQMRADAKVSHQNPLYTPSAVVNENPLYDANLSFRVAAAQKRPSFAELSEKLRVFGIPLDKACDMSCGTVPLVVTELVAAVEERGLHTEGIYRLSGSQEEVFRIRTCYDRGDIALDLGPTRCPDVHSIAGALKLYLRELPEPLFIRSLFEEWRDVAGMVVGAVSASASTTAGVCDESTRLTRTRELLSRLPKCNRSTARFLFAHLERVAAASGDNKMGPANLGIVFGPTLFVGSGQLAPSDTLESLTQGAIESKAMGALVAWMIGAPRALFADTQT
eukprot:Opistho-2@51041